MRHLGTITLAILCLSLAPDLVSTASAQSWSARSLTDNGSLSNIFDARNFRNCGGILFLSGRGYFEESQTWISRGTALTTVPLSTYSPDTTTPTNPSSFTKVANTVFFVAEDPLNGRELWKCDLTTFQTSLVKNIIPGPNSPFRPGTLPTPMAECDGKLLFVCNGDNGTAYGEELWESNGTESGTKLVRDIRVGPNGSNIGPLTTIENRVYFSATSNNSSDSAAWISDGTRDGTFRLVDPGVSSANPGAFTSFNNGVYFLMKSRTSSGRYSLWTVSAQRNSATVVKEAVAVGWDHIAKTTTHMFFRGFSTADGYELWKSDGTATNTGITKNIHPTGNGITGLWTEMAPLSNLMIFVADDGVRGSQLWKSDGTNTSIVDPVFNSSKSYEPAPHKLIPFANKVFVRMRRDGHGFEWWETNGMTVSGAPAVDIDPGEGSGLFSYLSQDQSEQIVVGANLFFVGRDINVGQELWRIGPPLSITTQPQSRLVAKGAAASFSVAVSSTAGIGYTWRKNGTTIPSEISASYSITSTALTDAGNYQVIAEGDDGTATSAVAKLGVVDTNVAPKSAVAGGTLSLTVSAAAPSGTTFGYSWRRGTTTLTNGGVISGATSATLTISKLSAAETGSYTCVVTMGSLSVTTQPAAVTIAVLPVVNTQPQSRLVKSGTSVTFNVVAADTASLSYQWKWNGANIAGATAASYALSNAQPGNAGEYRCVLTNPGGSVNSNVARLGVVTEALAGTSPINMLAGGALSSPAGLAAPSTATLTYQWRRNTVAVANVTNASGSTYGGTQSNTFSISNTQLSDAGFYSCTVGMDSLTLTVGKFDLIVKSKPVITTTAVPSAAISGPYTWQITSIGGTATYKISGLPPGVVYNTNTGLISGTPTKVGSFNVKITGVNEVGTGAVQTFLLIVSPLSDTQTGSYSATIARSRAINGNLGGLISLTVLSNGTYTGKVGNGLAPIPIKGSVIASLTGDPRVVVPVRRLGMLDLLLDVTLAGVAQTVTGTVSDGTDSAEVSGGKHIWSAQNPALDYAGNFNVTDNIRSAYTADSYPKGRGTLKLGVSASGAIAASGSKPDGTTYSFSAVLWPSATFPIYTMLYSGRGSVSGTAQVSLGATSDAADDRITSTNAWFKMKSPNPKERLYGAGFDVPDAGWGGSRWMATAKGQVPLNWPLKVENAKINVVRGGIEFATQHLDLLQKFTLSTTGSATFNKQLNVCGITLKVDPATGIYSGSFKLVDPNPSGLTPISRSVRFSGLLIPYINAGYGRCFLPQLPAPGVSPSDAPIFTARFDFGPQ